MESGIELRDPSAREFAAERDEPLSPEDEERRRAYSDWLARFESGNAAA